jgi:hypothetical protein
MSNVVSNILLGYRDRKKQMWGSRVASRQTTPVADYIHRLRYMFFAKEILSEPPSRFEMGTSVYIPLKCLVNFSLAPPCPLLKHKGS